MGKSQYAEIVDALMGDLAESRPGARVASEHEIAARFAVSRAVAGAALRELESRLLVRRVHQRFEAQTRDAARVNADTLRAILHHHRDTVFGREHGLASLRTVADYQRALPLRDYAFFQPYVERIARGEQRVLSADPVEYLGVTSGTTGQSKRHPVTRRQLRLLRDSMLVGRAKVAQQLPAARRPAPALLLMNSYLRERTEGG